MDQKDIHLFNKLVKHKSQKQYNLKKANAESDVDERNFRSSGGRDPYANDATMTENINELVALFLEAIWGGVHTDPGYYQKKEQERFSSMNPDDKKKIESRRESLSRTKDTYEKSYYSHPDESLDKDKPAKSWEDTKKDFFRTRTDSKLNETTNINELVWLSLNED